MNVIENDGLAEIDPDDLFFNIRAALLAAIDGKLCFVLDHELCLLFLFLSFNLTGAHILAEDVLCMGISLQRATFITFDKVTGKPYHQLISWKDARGDSFVRKVNASLLLKIINIGASFLYKIFRSDRMKQGSNFRLQDCFVKQVHVPCC
jgi:glycerol kinase